MCGRTACTLNPSEISARCRYRNRENKKEETPKWRDGDASKYQQGYNNAPQSFTPTLVSGRHFKNYGGPGGERQRVLVSMKWGLIPSWAKEINAAQYKTSNARSDGMLEKASYKRPLHKGQRCVVLSEGFYEWNTTKTGKQPYFIYFPQCKEDDKSQGKAEHVEETDNEFDHKKLSHLVAMAGIFEKREITNEAGEREELFSYAVITVDAHKSFEWLHHRMPAILQNDDEINDWLDFVNVPLAEAVQKLIKPKPGLVWHPVDKLVNNSRNNIPECLQKVDLSAPKIPAKPANKLMANWLNSPSNTKKVVDKVTKPVKRKSENYSSLDKWIKKPK